MSIPDPEPDGYGDAKDDWPAQDQPPQDQQAAALPIMTLGVLVEAYPRLRAPVIDGLSRRGETMNIIAASKAGKSWLVYCLLLCVAMGRRWLDTFGCTAGRALLIDNELHSETLAKRLPRVAEALGIRWEEVRDRVDVLPLRGRLMDLNALGAGLLQIPHGRYALVVIDAWYRAMPVGMDENDNGKMAGLYNLLDKFADSLGCSFVLIHHSSKGNQSSKSITDVGSGAGSQSRAADTHLILRTHKEPNAIVLEAAVRSFAPVAPLCLRWDWPIWTPAPDLDPTELREARPRRRKPEGDEPAMEKPPPWNAKRFADSLGKPQPQARGQILEDAAILGLSNRMAGELLKRAIECGYLHQWRADGQANRQMVSTVPPPAPEPPAPEPAPIPEEPPPANKKRPRKRRKMARK